LKTHHEINDFSELKETDGLQIGLEELSPLEARGKADDQEVEEIIRFQ